ncbi:MAG TPA: phosphorylase [Xanthobacteraceae bacterium]|nr:phosphorylase [Xanthobacteraceae bacterium]
MSGVHPVIAVTCLAFEADIAAGPGVSVICGNALNLADVLQAAIKSDCAGIISFGVAGGLDPKLQAGDVVVATGVVTENNRRPTHIGWSQNLLRALPGASYADIAGVVTPVATAQAKRELHEKTNTAAVDMESHIAAEVAAAHDLPFAACRVIIDPAERDLPPAALIDLGPKGNADLPAIAASLARRPGQLPSLIKVAADAWFARTALLRVRHSLGTHLGFTFPAQPIDTPWRRRFYRRSLSGALSA